ncbi:hypothetical protein TorRG33x02_343000 [Trema orientale]|uniref:Uncharacterized protein n=1 Tax=Trema orientale TaxID=63057 RepID=A0A2P5ARZ5_TREOI|nr:hypothetical protein TorRG33x02_343000 [Trema orientale]
MVTARELPRSRPQGKTSEFQHRIPYIHPRHPSPLRHSSEPPLNSHSPLLLLLLVARPLSRKNRRSKIKERTPEIY